MSVHEDALRDLAANHGWGFCDAVADEINDLEASYASLFKTHGELQRDLASAQSEITSLTANLSARNAEILEAQEELRAVGGHVGGGAFYRDEHGGRLPMRDQVGQHIAEMNQKLAAAQEELERERMRLVACGVVAMANTPESAADARQIHEDYRSASLSDVERAVNAEMKLRTDLAAAQEWREAVLNELIVAHIYTKEHDTNPSKAIQDAITWNCQVALDPAVSEDAQKLISAAQEALNQMGAAMREARTERDEAQEARKRAEEEDLKTRMMYHDALERAAACELVAKGKLWLWKNFVDGRPEYWAFDNPFPINLDNGDPQTLGEPCGYALFKPSRVGRTDVSDEEVLRRIDSAIAARAK